MTHRTFDAGNEFGFIRTPDFPLPLDGGGLGWG
jgi:hypothetical protein